LYKYVETVYKVIKSGKLVAAVFTIIGAYIIISPLLSALDDGGYLRQKWNQGKSWGCWV